jgi:hypothetical protein
MIARGRKGPGSMASRDSCVSLCLGSCQGTELFCLQCNVLSRLPVGGTRHTVIASLQLSATDVSARTTMKGAAKCDKHCDLQNSVNQQGFERILRFRDTPESMPASVSSSVSCFWWIPQPLGKESACQMPVFVHQGASALDASNVSSCCR